MAGYKPTDFKCIGTKGCNGATVKLVTDYSELAGTYIYRCTTPTCNKHYISQVNYLPQFGGAVEIIEDLDQPELAEDEIRPFSYMRRVKIG